MRSFLFSIKDLAFRDVVLSQTTYSDFCSPTQAFANFQLLCQVVLHAFLYELRIRTKILILYIFWYGKMKAWNILWKGKVILFLKWNVNKIAESQQSESLLTLKAVYDKAVLYSIPIPTVPHLSLIFLYVISYTSTMVCWSINQCI